MFHLLSRAIGIAILVLVFAVEGLAENTCAGKASLVNPHTSARSSTDEVIVQSGIGGTGIQDGGIGGTGNKEGGIGGTGGQMANDGGIGGTGIVGVITGFASICVNGVEIHYDPDTPVSVDGQSSTIHGLAAGQMVVVRAHGIGNEVTARNIAVVNAVVGPIDGINPATGEMRILDQTIQVRGSDRLANLKTGEWVQVSGHRLSNRAVVASHIEPYQPHAQARIAKINGHITQVDTKGFSVDGTRIELKQQALPADITLGVEVSVSGHWDNASLQAQHIQVDPTLNSMGDVEHVVIEGYVHALHGRELHLSNRIITLEADVQISGDEKDTIDLNQLVQVSGRLGPDLRVIVDRIELRHESFTRNDESSDGGSSGSDSERGRNDSNSESNSRSDDQDGKNENRGSERSGNSEDNYREEPENRSNNDRPSNSGSHSSGSSTSSGHESEQPEQRIDNSDPDSSGHEQRDREDDSHSRDASISSEQESREESRDFDSSGESSDHLDRSDDFDSSGRNDHLDRPDDLDSSDRLNDNLDRPDDFDTSGRSSDHLDRSNDFDDLDRIRDHDERHDMDHDRDHDRHHDMDFDFDR